MTNNKDNQYISSLEELGIDPDDVGRDTKHSYRVILYSKMDVESMEKRIIKEMLSKNQKGPYSDSFLIKAYNLFPESFADLEGKKKKREKVFKLLH